MSEAEQRPGAQVFRLPWLAYLAVLFVTFCTVPIALVGTDNTNDPGLSWRVLLLVVPVLVAVYIARTRTRVDADGIEIRALFGTRRFGWDQLRGLAVDRSVYVVSRDGDTVRLPCVRPGDLHLIAAASGGRLPEVDAPTPKFAPARRRR